MSRLTSDPNDPELSHGVDEGPVEQAPAYLVLSEDERKKGFVRPVRKSYWHERCGVITTMSRELAETYARDPKFYGATYCTGCRMHLRVGEDGDFYWVESDWLPADTFFNKLEYIAHMKSAPKVGT